jgi:MoaA/NifB/PqqE/SkfB family radical SAM enzyme
MATVTTIDLGSACNNQCIFCALAPRSDVLPGADAVTSQLHTAAADGAVQVVFIGGEPLIHDSLPSWIATARTLGIPTVSVQTNGRALASRAAADALNAAGLTHVEVSLYGHQSNVHDYHTDIPGSFRHTARALLNLRELSVTVGLSTVITRSNYRHLEAVAALAVKVGAAAWHPSIALPLGDGRQAALRIVPNPEMVQPYLDKALKRCERASIAVQWNEGRTNFPFAPQMR